MPTATGKWQPTVTTVTSNRVYTNIAGTFIQWDNTVYFECQLEIGYTTGANFWSNATFDLSLPAGSAIEDDSLNGILVMQNMPDDAIGGYVFETTGNRSRVTMLSEEQSSTQTLRIRIQGSYVIDDS